MVWAKRLIQLYPADWRERYAEEMLGILEEHPPTFWTLANLFISLCDAHLHSDLVSGGMFSVAKQFYSSVTTIFSVGLMFCLLSFALPLVLTDVFRTAIPLHQVTTLHFFQPMLFALNSLSYLLVIFLVLCGASLFFSSGMQAFKTHRILSFFLYLFSALCPLIALLVSSLVEEYAYSLYLRDVLKTFHLSLSGSINLMLFLVSLLFGLVFFLIIVMGIWALRVALRRVVPGIRSTNLLFVSATMISVIMLVYSCSLLFLSLYSFSSGFGVQIGIALNERTGVLLLISILLTLYSLMRAHQARRTLTTLAR